MTTKRKNKGIGDGSGRWLMDEFLLEDGRWAKFVVAYRPVWIDMKNEPEWPTRFSFEVESVRVLWSESEAYTADGWVTGVSQLPEIRSQILEAFQDNIEDVELYEREYR